MQLLRLSSTLVTLSLLSFVFAQSGLLKGFALVPDYFTSLDLIDTVQDSLLNEMAGSLELTLDYRASEVTGSGCSGTGEFMFWSGLGPNVFSLPTRVRAQLEGLGFTYQEVQVLRPERDNETGSVFYMETGIGPVMGVTLAREALGVSFLNERERYSHVAYMLWCLLE